MKLSNAELRWAAGKHRQRYRWGEIGEALFVDPCTVSDAVKDSGYPYELPPLVMPENVPDNREFAWESLLDGYNKKQIAKAMRRSEGYVNKLLQGRKKVMPRLVTRWIKDERQTS